MASATTARMTADEFFEFVHKPENENRWFELVRGEVIELPPPMKIHGRVSVRVGFLLENYVRQRSYGYVTGNDSGVILERDPDTVRGPDLALYEDAQSFEELHPKYGENPPVLAVEVLSPNDKPGRVINIIFDYLNNGVRVVWLVDPPERTVEVFRPGQRAQRLTEADELVGDPELPGFRAAVRDLFFVPRRPETPA
jgi:Uma2 family endonuclease